MYIEEFYSLDCNDYPDCIFTINDISLNYHKEMEFRDYLDKFISSLSSQDRMICELYSNDYSYKDMSKILNLSTKKIDNRLVSLRKRLRRHINTYNQQGKLI